MRAYEFIKPIIVEYKRDVTSRQFGKKIIQQMLNGPDSSRYKYDLYFRLYHDNNIWSSSYDDPYDEKKLLKEAFEYFESADPTYDYYNNTGGLYIPWIAREYSKGNIRRFEDMDTRVRNTLEKYDTYKKLQNFPSDYKDIMRLSFPGLEQIVKTFAPKYTEREKGKYKVLYEDDNVMLISLLDLQSSKYWCNYNNEEAVWCTRYPDAFAEYIKKGPLYVIIPKEPKHPGEKYQIHFQTKQYMDENDDDFDFGEMLKKRYPQLIPVFKKVDNSFNKYLIFADPNTVSKIFYSIVDILLYEVNNNDLEPRQIRFLNEYLNKLKNYNPDQIIDIVNNYLNTEYSHRLEIYRIKYVFDNLFRTDFYYGYNSGQYYYYEILSNILSDIVVRKQQDEKPYKGRDWQVFDVVDDIEIGLAKR